MFFSLLCTILLFFLFFVLAPFFVVRLRNRVAKVGTFFEITKKCAVFIRKIWAFCRFLVILHSENSRKVINKYK